MKTIPCYRDATHPDCQLDGSLSPATVIPPYSNTKSWYDLLNARSAIGLFGSCSTFGEAHDVAACAARPTAQSRVMIV